MSVKRVGVGLGIGGAAAYTLLVYSQEIKSKLNGLSKISRKDETYDGRPSVCLQSRRSDLIGPKFACEFSRSIGNLEQFVKAACLEYKKRIETRASVEIDQLEKAACSISGKLQLLDYALENRGLSDINITKYLDIYSKDIRTLLKADIEANYLAGLTNELRGITLFSLFADDVLVRNPVAQNMYSEESIHFLNLNLFKDWKRAVFRPLASELRRSIEADFRYYCEDLLRWYDSVS